MAFPAVKAYVLSNSVPCRSFDSSMISAAAIATGRNCLSRRVRQPSTMAAAARPRSVAGVLTTPTITAVHPATLWRNRTASRPVATITAVNTSPK